MFPLSSVAPALHAPPATPASIKTLKPVTNGRRVRLKIMGDNLTPEWESVELKAPALELLRRYQNFLGLQSKRSPRTVESYTAVATRFMKFCDGRTATRELVRAWVREDSARLSPSSQALATSALKNFFTWGAKLE